MKVRIQILQPCCDVENRLCDDGWEVAAEGGHCLVAENIHVTSQKEARQRLYQLGLLISSALKIEIPLVGRQ